MNVKGPTEVELKAAILNGLIASRELSDQDIVVSELPLGQTSVRADLVTLSQDNRICGIEIKSDRDSLTRLPRQICVYQEYFDRVILVVGERHLKRVISEELAGIDLWVARGSLIEVVRHASSTPSAISTGLDLLSQKQLRQARGQDERSAFCGALRSRFSATSATFWRAINRRPIMPADLRLLSRFEQLRVVAAQAQANEEALWDQWAEFFRHQSLQSSSVS